MKHMVLWTAPQEFQFIYAYCTEHDIPVEMIDWYVVDESTVEK